jgi:hypothetical protein
MTDDVMAVGSMFLKLLAYILPIGSGVAMIIALLSYKRGFPATKISLEGLLPAKISISEIEKSGIEAFYLKKINEYLEREKKRVIPAYTTTAELCTEFMRITETAENKKRGKIEEETRKQLDALLSGNNTDTKWAFIVCSVIKTNSSSTDVLESITLDIGNKAGFPKHTVKHDNILSNYSIPFHLPQCGTTTVYSVFVVEHNIWISACSYCLKIKTASCELSVNFLK